MDRLSSIDAGFLYAETAESPMHVAGIDVFEPPKAGVNVFERYRNHIEARLHLLPFFRRRLCVMPIELDNPIWVEDANVDLDYHIRHLALPPPGTMEQLRSLVARLHMIILDRSRPLWQFHVIEGLQGGGFAIYTKMHHAGLDGGAGMVALETMFSASPESPPVDPPAKRPPQRAPDPFEMLGNVYKEFWQQQARMFETWFDRSKVANFGRSPFGGALRPPEQPSLAPKTPFNVALSNDRSIGISSVSLSEVKTLSKAQNAKLNDVVLAICAGALRRYLGHRGMLPKEPLIAGVPVSLRKPGDVSMNNQLTVMLCSLATDVADPIFRLAAIVKSSKDGKERLGGVDETPQDVVIFGAPLVLTALAQWASRTKAADHLPAASNVVISNMLGPRKPLYCAGSMLLNSFPISLATNGNALNMTVQSYMDNLDFGLIACRTAVPDVQALADLVVEEFEVLKRAAAAAHPDDVAIIDVSVAKQDT
jgi:WS/DGAT/MGAT family acyltransferase